MILNSCMMITIIQILHPCLKVIKLCTAKLKYMILISDPIVSFGSITLCYNLQLYNTLYTVLRGVIKLVLMD